MRYLITILALAISACSAPQTPLPVRPPVIGSGVELIDHAGSPCTDPWELWCGREKLMRCEPSGGGGLHWRGLATCPRGCSVIPLKCQG